MNTTNNLQLGPIEEHKQPTADRLARAAYAVYDTAAYIGGIVAETIIDTITEGNEASGAIADEHAQILDAFTKLPIDQQDAYLALQQEDAKEARKRRMSRILHAPSNALRGLFTMSSERQPVESNP